MRGSRAISRSVSRAPIRSGTLPPYRYRYRSGLLVPFGAAHRGNGIAGTDPNAQRPARNASSASTWARTLCADGPPGDRVRRDARVGIEQRSAPGNPERLPLLVGHRRQRAAPAGQLLEQRPGPTVRLAERHPRLDQRLGEVGGVEALGGACVTHRRDVEPHGRHRPRDRRQDEVQRVHRVEERLLVLLEVAVVAGRQAVQHRRDRHEVRRHTCRLPADEFSGIGVPLLRHHARAGGVGLVEFGPCQRLVGPSSKIRRQARKVGRGDRRHRQELLDEITIAHRVDRVRERPAHAQPLGGGRRIQPQRGGRRRAGAQRGCGRTIGPLREPLEVAGARPRVRQQVVAERHGLGETRVGRTGHHGRLMLTRALDQHGHQRADRSVDPCAGVEQPEPQVGHDQIVARPPRVELGAEVAEAFGDLAFHDRVDVFVGGTEDDRARCELLADLGQRGIERFGFIGGEQSGGQQRADMRARGANIRLTQPLVEVQGTSQGVRLGCRRRREPSRPQRAVLAHAPRSPCVADHVLRPRPYSRTNPAASD